MKRVACSVLVGGLVCGFAWIWGFDFNERGGVALVVAYLAVAASLFAYFCPAWTE